MIKPIVWTIAGSDSGGGAGIQADLTVFNNLDTFGCSAITVLTAQNSMGVVSIQETSAQVMRDQLFCLGSDLPPKAVKLGMLFSEGIMREVVSWLADYKGPVICDPVMVTTSGDLLLQENAKDYLIAEIIPKSSVVTPNIFETEVIVGYQVRTPEKVMQAAQDILALGAKSVLIKGGHGSATYCHDYWSNGEQDVWISSPRSPSHNNHGSGCSLSSAITAFVARGESLLDAIVLAKMYINQGLRLSVQYGAGPGPLEKQPLRFDDCDLPYVASTFVEDPAMTHASGVQPTEAFLALEDAWLGVYPVVDSAEWVEKLVPLGIEAIQLRMKGAPESALRPAIIASVAAANAHNVKLFVNDHWQLAIELGAYGVHLGQDDLETADLSAIQQAGLRLGISTHGAYEIVRSMHLMPSYLAFGSVFLTTSKPVVPKGVESLALYCRLSNVPMVAIGGINMDTIADAFDSGASGYAMISAITQADQPELAVAQMQALLN